MRYAKKTMTAIAWCAVLLAGGPASAMTFDQPHPALSDLFDKSSVLAVVQAVSVDTHAGGGEQPITRVEFEVQNDIYENIPSPEVVFDFPEGVWAEENLLVIPGAPKFTSGDKYLVFFTRGPWNFTPVVYGQMGVFRFATVDGEDFLTTPHGYCVADVGDAMSIGPRIAWTQKVPGPRIDGSQHYIGFRHSDFYEGLEPPNFGENAQSCLPATEVISSIENAALDYFGGEFPPNEVETSCSRQSTLEYPMATSALDSGATEINLCIQEIDVCEQPPDVE